jgi:hypothetical protein
VQEFQREHPSSGVCHLYEETEFDQNLRPTHCPFCETKIYEHGRAFTCQLQRLVARNAKEKKYAWAQLILALDHLGMIGRQVEIPGNNLIVGGVRNVSRGTKLLKQSAAQKTPRGHVFLGSSVLSWLEWHTRVGRRGHDIV